jgi:hypothetical protein
MDGVHIIHERDYKFIKSLVGELGKERHLGMSRCRWDDNIKIDCKAKKT